MHKADITIHLVARLIAEQFPHWAELPITPVAIDGWDNTTFRLGATMTVRLPSADIYSAQVAKEQLWLPRLGSCLPLPIPAPLAMGRPSDLFPRPWSIYRWIDGERVTTDTVHDLAQLADDLAGFLTALQRCDPTGGPVAGEHSFFRGSHVATWDASTRAALASLAGVLDVERATAVWTAAVDATPTGPPVWVHGDVTASNLLARDGRLSAVLDFGCCAIGDPACDTAIAWTVFEGPSRDVFMSRLPVDAGVWARGRGWALWKAVMELVTDQQQPGHAVSATHRYGWRQRPAEVVMAVIDEHHRHASSGSHSR
jgi:aminoglycoside phosphotransferase (APT) family kinase protein